MLKRELNVRWFILGLLVFGLASPAAAEWHQAESEHFVIIANDSGKNVRRFAEVLESYHSAMEVVTGRQLPKPSPSNRVTIYALGSARDVQALVDPKMKTLQGFYIARAGASVAFVQDLRSTGKEPDEAMSTLLHEYAHHFLISSQRMAMPKWMSEGAAEFFSSAAFQSDGRIDVGLPNFSREGELFFADAVPIRQLLDEDLYLAKAGKHYDAFYGRSWLLYHYLMFDPERQGQLNKYWLETARGTPRLAAAEKTLGDLDVLDKSLDRYLKSRQWKIYSALPEQIRVGTITVKPLTAGNVAMLPVITVSKRGVNEDQAKALVIKARAIAAKYPADVAVLSALAEAEHDAGNEIEAIAAADRALAIDPAAKDALLQKGLALFARASDADDRRAAYTAAMQPFEALNRLESDHPFPLIYGYRGYLARGEVPPQPARTALVRAARLAPFDLGLAFEVGSLFASEGSVAAAVGVLQPIAGNPHGDELSVLAKALIKYLDGKPEGVPVSLAGFARAVDQAEASDQPVR
jgi:tetratricopeptide (TPR) repeat protein